MTQNEIKEIADLITKRHYRINPLLKHPVIMITEDHPHLTPDDMVEIAKQYVADHDEAAVSVEDDVVLIHPQSIDYLQITKDIVGG